MTGTIQEVETRNVATARRYFAAIERREEVATIAEYLHLAIVQEEFPNRLNPQGGRSDYATILSRMAKGRQLLTGERYEIVGEVAVRDRVALEVLWSGTLAIPLGDQLPAGSTIRARFGVFLDFEEGRIIAQRNYDCFEPW
jgi:ketosteroid isomerase-like protein